MEVYARQYTCNKLHVNITCNVMYAYTTQHEVIRSAVMFVSDHTVTRCPPSVSLRMWSNHIIINIHRYVPFTFESVDASRDWKETFHKIHVGTRSL